MKRLVSAIVFAVFLFSLTATAFAAQIFSDVPAKHWAYDAVAKLAKAGLIEGYGDGTFRGDRSMNRYEFATLTVRALERFDRASDEQKQLIDKLSAEFAAELNRMGARLAKVEAKTNAWVIGGDARFRYLHNDPKYPGGSKLKGSDATDWRVRVKVAGTINDDTLLQARFSTNYGIKFGNAQSASEPFGNTAYVDIANVTFRNALSFDSIRLGRTPLDFIGCGLLGKPMAVDGVTIYDTWGTTKFTAFTGNIKTDTSNSGNPNQLTTGDISFKLSDNLRMGLGYFWADIPGTSGAYTANMLAEYGSYKSSRGYDLSFKAKVAGLNVLGDYVGTTLDGASRVADSPKAWSVQVSNGDGPGATAAYYPTSYLLVKPTKVGAGAWAVIYRQADPGALPAGAGGFDTTAVSYNSTAYNIYGHGTDNVKAWYLVYQNVLAKNVVMSFEWQNLRVKNRSVTTSLTDDKLDNTFMTKLEVFF